MCWIVGRDEHAVCFGCVRARVWSLHGCTSCCARSPPVVVESSVVPSFSGLKLGDARAHRAQEVIRCGRGVLRKAMYSKSRPQACVQASKCFSKVAAWPWHHVVFFNSHGQLPWLISQQQDVHAVGQRARPYELRCMRDATDSQLKQVHLQDLIL